MQVVHHGRLPVQVRVQDVTGEREPEPVSVAIVVVRDVLSPVAERRPHPIVGLPVPVGVHHPVAAIGLGGRHDDRDRAVPDRVDEGGLFHRQPVGQLHHHLRRSRLGRVQPGGDVVDRLRACDHLQGLVLGDSSGIREPIDRVPIAVETRERRFVGDDHLDHLPTLLRSPDRVDLDPGGGRGQRPHIPVYLIGVVEDIGGSDDRPEVIQRRRDGLRGGQVVDQLVEEPLVGGVLADLLRVGVIVALLRQSSGRGARPRQPERQTEPESVNDPSRTE